LHPELVERGLLLGLEVAEAAKRGHVGRVDLRGILFGRTIKAGVIGEEKVSLKRGGSVTIAREGRGECDAKGRRTRGGVEGEGLKSREEVKGEK
jgi:hypothetical protein